MNSPLLNIVPLMVVLAGCETVDPPTRVVYNDLELVSGQDTTILPGSEILTVKLAVDSLVTDGGKIDITLTSAGTAVFADVTKRSVGQLLLITVAGRPILSATVMKPILDGRIVITGYGRQEAGDIVDSLVKKPKKAA